MRTEPGFDGVGMAPVEFEAICELPASRLRVLLSDFTRLLGQQMYFWGQDVVHPRGNLLREHGFERRRSEGLQGTSCYRKCLGGGGYVELHGACAGFYSFSRMGTGNFLYVRNRSRCYLYSGDSPPAPGFYPRDLLRSNPVTDLYVSSLRFLNWWLEYESWVRKTTWAGWREQNYSDFAKLPASKPALPPREAGQWLRQYRYQPAKITRVRELMRALKRTPPRRPL
ncbi:MAG: hypothetical protein ACR2RV_05865 [Verrucomicrobiales bacterium]